MNITTDRLQIDALTAQDAAALTDVLSDPEVMRYIEPPFTGEQTQAFIRATGQGDPPLVYALRRRADGALLGHVIYHPYDTTAWEIGWVLGKAHWRRGYAAEITAALLADAAARGIAELVLECHPGQQATRRLAQRFAFIYQGIQDGCAIYRRPTCEPKKTRD